MTYSNNWLDLENKLIKAVGSTLQNEVFEKIRDVEQEHITSDVYDVYDPKVYPNIQENVYRRGMKGGLIADENIKLNVINDLTINITNETPPNPYARDGATIDKNLPELIEYGHNYKGYRYDYARDGAAYMEARPFTENTVEDLKQNKQHIKALKEGLKKRGLSST